MFTALTTPVGNVTSMCQPRHRHTGWLRLLRLIERKSPKGLTLLLIVDNEAPHSQPEAWLSWHPRFVTHLTPTDASR